MFSFGFIFFPVFFRVCVCRSDDNDVYDGRHVAWHMTCPQVSGNAAWASEMAEALRAELTAAEAVQAGQGPWLTVTASFAHQAGRDPTSIR